VGLSEKGREGARKGGREGNKNRGGAGGAKRTKEKGRSMRRGVEGKREEGRKEEKREEGWYIPCILSFKEGEREGEREGRREGRQGTYIVVGVIYTPENVVVDFLCRAAEGCLDVLSGPSTRFQE